MLEQLISFETSKLAKYKGFDINQFYEAYALKDLFENEEGSYLCGHIIDLVFEQENFIGEYINQPFCYRVTQSLLQKWLREEHSIEIWLGKKGAYYHVEDITVNDYIKYEDNENFTTYEEAIEKGLLKGLKLIK